VAPSAIKPDETAGKAFTEDGYKPFMVPRELETDEVAALVQDYVRAAQNAMDAGFDGVEIHAANGYLLNQFLSDNTNQRSDQYGGSVENRSRLLLEIVDAVSSVIGSKKVGVRISPWGLFLDCHDSSPGLLYSYLAKQLDERWISYLSVVEREWMGETDKSQDDCPPCITAFIRQYFKGLIITAGGYDKTSAAAVLESGDADLVAFGKHFIANPDLPRRLFEDAALNSPVEETFYGGDEKGYTDYPYLSE
jgi:N-ethylmaleimide reductase